MERKMGRRSMEKASLDLERLKVSNPGTLK